MLPLPLLLLMGTGLAELAIGVPPERKVTLPVGANPPLLVMIVAVKVTVVPVPTALLLEATDDDVGAFVTVILIGCEALALKLRSPP